MNVYGLLNMRHRCRIIYYEALFTLILMDNLTWRPGPNIQLEERERMYFKQSDISGLSEIIQVIIQI